MGAEFWCLIGFLVGVAFGAYVFYAAEKDAAASNGVLKIGCKVYRLTEIE